MKQTHIGIKCLANFGTNVATIWSNVGQHVVDICPKNLHPICSPSAHVERVEHGRVDVLELLRVDLEVWRVLHVSFCLREPRARCSE